MLLLVVGSGSGRAGPAPLPTVIPAQAGTHGPDSSASRICEPRPKPTAPVTSPRSRSRRTPPREPGRRSPTSPQRRRRYNRPMPYHVYILRCSDGSYYIGHTDSLEARLAAHQSRHIKGYTHTRRPVTLVFTQEFATREEAGRASERLRASPYVRSDRRSQRGLRGNLTEDCTTRPYSNRPQHKASPAPGYRRSLASRQVGAANRQARNLVRKFLSLAC